MPNIVYAAYLLAPIELNTWICSVQWFWQTQKSEFNLFSMKKKTKNNSKLRSVCKIWNVMRNVCHSVGRWRYPWLLLTKLVSCWCLGRPKRKKLSVIIIIITHNNQGDGMISTCHVFWIILIFHPYENAECSLLLCMLGIYFLQFFT